MNLKTVLSNTWASVVLLCVFALCATALVWHGDLSIAQLKSALVALGYGAGVTWLRGAQRAPELSQ